MSFARDAGVARRMVFDAAFTTNNTAWFAASDGLRAYDGYHWHRFTSADGLPSSFIRTVAVTRDGTLWLGSDKGAGVFDGETFDRRGTDGRLAGPNVRRIVETADGALWFCCDRWPDATSPGGLTRLGRDGVRTYAVSDGLPSDHVLGLFEQSNGRLIALTTGGPAVKTGETWTPLTDPGFPPGDHTWAMAETPDGELFAQSFERTLVWRGGGWAACDEPRGSTTAPFCVAVDGALVHVAMLGADTLTFTRWNGEFFQPASAEVSVPGVDELVARAAPDGAIWVLGRGTILRWDYLSGAWDWWPELPPPRLEDRSHGLWFAGATNAVLLANESLRDFREMHWPMVEDPAGGMWAAGETGVVRWMEDRIQSVALEESGVSRLEGGVADAAGAVWLYGRGRLGDPVVARVQDGAWSVHDARALEGRAVLSMAAHARDGVWAVLNDEDSGVYELARLTANGLELAPVQGEKPPVHRPSVAASREHLYLSGYAGLWESPPDGPLTFRKVEPYGSAVYTQAASIGDVTAFIAQEGPAGSAAILVRRGSEWLRQPVAYGQELWLGRDGWMMVADGADFALWQTRNWSGVTYVSLPTDTTITAMLRGSDGDYWVGTYQGVLRYRAGSTAPDTVVTGPGTLVAGTPAFVQARGHARFVPLARAPRFSFTWRLDDGPWSGYDDWPQPGVPLDGVPPGTHVLEARARDGTGNEDPTPARLEFAVRTVPIQDRRWFRPGLGATGVALAGLSAALFAAVARVRRYAGGLEREVEARTIQLRTDIQRREQIEQALRDSEERHRRIVETAHEGIWCGDAEARTSFVNRRLPEMLGCGAREMLGRPIADFLHPEDATSHLATLEGRQPDRAEPVECRYRHARGGWRWMSVSTTSQVDAAGRFAGSFAMLTDITGRKQAEEALLASEERARRQRAAIATLVLDGAMAAGDVPLSLRRMTEVLVEAMAVARASIWSSSDDDTELRCDALFVAATRQHAPGTVLRTADYPRYFAAIRTESRIAAEQAVADPRTSELAAGYLIPLGVRSMLDAAVQVEGRLVGVVCLEHIGEVRKWHADEEAFASTAAAMVAQIRVNARRREAESERERLQGQLLQAQKMESVGRLAGGVAHDFNNMLQAILGHADLALHDLAPDSPLRENLEEILRSAQRSADLTRQLLAFARKQTIAPRVLDLNDTVAGMLKMLRRLVSEDINLAWVPGADLWAVRMDPGQVDQVLANLCVNARDAITGAGHVTIATHNVTLGADADEPAGAPPGEYVLLEVSDTGQGMTAETRAHLFEPYFTTKDVGRGTGLGLATVFGIIQQNSGWISVKSAPGQGTTFRLYLPRCLAARSADGAPAVAGPPRGTETILLVEDEQQILDLGCLMLAQQGYTVLAAITPQAALAVADAHRGAIDLLVTDVIMPGMNGRELWERLRQRCPALRCLFMSGYTADVIAHHGVLAPGFEFLPKPFDIQTLATRVRGVLDQSPRPTG